MRQGRRRAHSRLGPGASGSNSGGARPMGKPILLPKEAEARAGAVARSPSMLDGVSIARLGGGGGGGVSVSMVLIWSRQGSQKGSQGERAVWSPFGKIPGHGSIQGKCSELWSLSFPISSHYQEKQKNPQVTVSYICTCICLFTMYISCIL